MEIKVAARLHPFSHTPGIQLLLPKSFWVCELFPALIVFKQIQTGLTHSVALSISGPVRDFTVEQDLEKRVVRVFGHTAKGYMRYEITREVDGILLSFEKTPEQGISCQAIGKEWTLKGKDLLLLPVTHEHPPVSFSEEKLSLGCHKAQDWDLIKRRQDLSEIFPFWLRLHALLPQVALESRRVGTLALLQKCQEADKDGILSAFHSLFLAAFSGLLVPRLIDEQHQGFDIPHENLPTDLSPLALLTEGAKLIRALFFAEREGKICLLPHLPSAFHSGRMVGIKTEKGDLFQMEWSKKLLRRALICPEVDGELHLLLQKQLKRFRLRRSKKERGIIVIAGEPLLVRAKEKLFLDRFEK